MSEINVSGGWVLLIMGPVILFYTAGVILIISQLIKAINDTFRTTGTR